MRLDLFLKKTCLVRQRSVAKEICDAGAVRVNDRVAKASHELQAGDVISLQVPQRHLEARVLEIPHGNVARRDAGRFVEILRDTRPDRIDEIFEAE